MQNDEPMNPSCLQKNRISSWRCFETLSFTPVLENDCLLKKVKDWQVLEQRNLFNFIYWIQEFPLIAYHQLVCCSISEYHLLKVHAQTFRELYKQRLSGCSGFLHVNHSRPSLLLGLYLSALAQLPAITMTHPVCHSTPCPCLPLCPYLIVNGTENFYSV